MIFDPFSLSPCFCATCVRLSGTLLTTMTGGFNSLRIYLTDLDIDLAKNERDTEDNARKSRRLNQRLMRVEQRDNDF